MKAISRTEKCQELEKNGIVRMFETEMKPLVMREIRNQWFDLRKNYVPRESFQTHECEIEAFLNNDHKFMFLEWNAEEEFVYMDSHFCKGAMVFVGNMSQIRAFSPEEFAEMFILQA